VLIGVGSATGSGGTANPDMTAYHLAFLASAAFALVGVLFSLSIHDSDAAETIVRRHKRVRPVPDTAVSVPSGSVA
jgi:hypothetical protein